MENFYLDHTKSEYFLVRELKLDQKMITLGLLMCFCCEGEKLCLTVKLDSEVETTEKKLQITKTTSRFVDRRDHPVNENRSFFSFK